MKTYVHLCTFMINISLNSTQNEKYLRQSCGEDQQAHLMFGNLFPEIVPFMR